MIWTQNGNGDWEHADGRQLCVPNTFYKIAIEKHQSYFDRSCVRYSVIALGTDEHGYSQDLTIKSFKSRNAAQNFADNLAALLNAETPQIDLGDLARIKRGLENIYDSLYPPEKRDLALHLTNDLIAFVENLADHIKGGENND